MTLEEMQQITLNHWRATDPSRMKKLGPARVQEESLACAKLTRLEMDTLMKGGMSEEQAWTEARGIFCLASMERLGL